MLSLSKRKKAEPTEMDKTDITEGWCEVDKKQPGNSDRKMKLRSGPHGLPKYNLL